MDSVCELTWEQTDTGANYRYRCANTSSSLNPFAQRYCLRLPPVSTLHAGITCRSFPLSAIHVIRVHAIYEKSRPVLLGLSSLFAVQIVVTAICCGFYRCTSFPSRYCALVSNWRIPAVPLDVGQGCIAGPKSNWVGIYWLAPTLLYTATVCTPIPISAEVI